MSQPSTANPAAAEIGVGVVGFWHVHATGYASDAQRHPRTSLVAGWDRNPTVAAQPAASLELPLVDSYEQLLAHPDVDAVTITTATSDHTEVIGQALRAGKHVFTEKILAPSVAECESLIAEAEANGLQLVVSLPRLYEPPAVAVREILAAGDLGAVTYARVRMSHNGWTAGWLPESFADPQAALGGAFTDLGCHPAYLIGQFLGTGLASDTRSAATTISATYGRFTDRAVDDNSVVVVGYPHGAIGVAEASFVTSPGTLEFELCGTEASIRHAYGDDAIAAKGGRFGDTWTQIPLPAAELDPFSLWVAAIDGDQDAKQTATTNRAIAVELTRMVVAANESAASGGTVTLAAR